jgi:Abi-like protein.
MSEMLRNKPKLLSCQLILKMKKEKGVTFSRMTEQDACMYLFSVNNYLRTASYRKNYQKYQKGEYKGKYISLDFAYLVELSTIDMHLRRIISKMCIDIEHDLKVRLLQEIELSPAMDGYSIVENFLRTNPYILHSLEAKSNSPFTSDLMQKYFTITQERDPVTIRFVNRIAAYSNCPVWVLFELITFGDLMRFYSFYYDKMSVKPPVPVSLINLVKSLRNGSSHNNCIIENLSHGTSKIPSEISQVVSKIPDITESQRKRRLSSRPMLEFTALLYVYDRIVSNDIRTHCMDDLKDLFLKRMTRNSDYFTSNELITASYRFACKVISYFSD